MIASFLIASWLLAQQWSWDAVTGASSYRLRWGQSGKAWCATDTAIVLNTACAAGRCAGDITMPPGPLVFVIVTAVISGTEYGTEHGPVQACP